MDESALVRRLQPAASLRDDFDNPLNAEPLRRFLNQ